MANARNNLLALACLLGICGIYAAVVPADSRIWGGEDVTSGQQPWVVSVRLDNAHTCVGTIVGSSYILTAAHCFSSFGTQAVEVNRVTARVGSDNQYAGGQIVSVKAINIHPSYANFLHDICVITLEKPLTFGDKIKSVGLAATDDELEVGSSVSVIGWGLKQAGASPYKLQQIAMKVQSESDCEYSAGYGYDSALCLEHPVNEGICRGDDGAGVIHDNKLVGTISFAFGSCGTKYPDVACRVSYYKEWIDSIIA